MSQPESDPFPIPKSKLFIKCVRGEWYFEVTPSVTILIRTATDKWREVIGRVACDIWIEEMQKADGLPGNFAKSAQAAENSEICERWRKKR